MARTQLPSNLNQNHPSTMGAGLLTVYAISMQSVQHDFGLQASDGGDAAVVKWLPSASRFKHANHPAKLGQEYVQECQKAATANGLHDYLKAKMAEREVGVGEGACDACRRVLEAMHVDWLHLLRHVLLGPRHILEGDTDLAIAE